MSGPSGGGQGRLLALARVPHVGKAGLILFVLLLSVDLGAERTGRIALITAGFLAFAALTATLFLLCGYDLLVSVLRIRYQPVAESSVPAPFRIGSSVLIEYARWLSPVGFVVGIIVGHYFWQ